MSRGARHLRVWARPVREAHQRANPRQAISRRASRSTQGFASGNTQPLDAISGTESAD